MRPASPSCAAVAVALALALGEASDDPGLRWYWAVLVAAVLVNGNWGETRRGLTRFSMTVVVPPPVGTFTCCSATAMRHGSLFCWHRSVSPSISAAKAMAGSPSSLQSTWSRCLKCCGVPTARITILRVYQTFIGCGIAMAASLFVPMPRASDRWESDAAEFVKLCRAAAGRSYDRLLKTAEPVDAIGEKSQTGIIPQLDKLQNDFSAGRYESIFQRVAHRRRNTFMDRAWHLALAALSLDSVSRTPLSASVLSVFRDDLTTLLAAVAGGSETSAPLESGARSPRSEPGSPTPAATATFRLTSICAGRRHAILGRLGRDGP